MTPDQIPYIVHEGMMARQERTIRRLWILCVIIFAAFVCSNLAWLYYESQFTDEVTTTYTSDARDGGNAVINDSGEVNINGKSDKNSDSSQGS